jgi:hypothetical protein
VLSRALPPDAARLAAARLLVAAVAALGLAALAWFGCVEGVAPWWTLLSVALAWLSSATVIVSLPDHFGLSFGLLLVAFVGAWSSVTRGRRAWWTWVAGALAIATTVTNGVLVAALVAWMAIAWKRSGGTAGRALRFHRWWVAAVVVLTAGAGAWAVPRAVARIRSGETIVTKYLHLQLVTEPVRSAIALPLSCSYPVVAGRPHIAGGAGEEGLSLEPWRLGDLTAPGAVGTLAWLVLLAGFAAAAWRPGASRQAVALLGGWVVFNWAFHSVWGDERFLYTPHWSWTFPLLALLAARAAGQVRAWWVTLLAVVLCAQVLAMAEIVTLARVWR